MRSSMVVGVLFVAVLLAGTQVLAGGIAAGTVELVPNTSFSYTSFSDDGNSLKVTNLRLGGTVGYFFTNLLELQTGILLDFTSVDWEGDETVSQTNTGMAAALVLNFPTEGQVVPFVGVGAGVVAHGGDVGSADKMTLIAPIVTGGLRFLIGNSASVNLGVSYEHQTDSGGVEDLSANMVSLNIGVSAFVVGGPAE